MKRAIVLALGCGTPGKYTGCHWKCQSCVPFYVSTAKCRQSAVALLNPNPGAQGIFAPVWQSRPVPIFGRHKAASDRRG